MELSEESGRALLEIACNQIRLRLGGEASGVGRLPIRAGAAGGCFVSVHDRRTHALRGCIGLLESERPLLETLVNAAQGVLKDPRFVMQPIELEELAELEVEITVLDPMRVAMSPLDFDPAVHGIFFDDWGAEWMFFAGGGGRRDGGGSNCWGDCVRRSWG